MVLALVVFVVALPFLVRAPEFARQEVLERIYPLRHEETIRAASAEHDLEPAFVAAVVYTESRFRPDAESHQGAYGLMQILPSTAEFIAARSGIRGDFREPAVNLRMGAWYLNYLGGRYRGDERLVLAAYNSGEGRVDAWISEEGFDVAEDIPFRETHEYVDDVITTRQAYRELYGRDLHRNSE